MQTPSAPVPCFTFTHTAAQKTPPRIRPSLLTAVSSKGGGDPDALLTGTLTANADGCQLHYVVIDKVRQGSRHLPVH